MSPKGNIEMVNRIGPSTDHWGSMHTNDVGFDWVPLIATDCDLPYKYNLNYLNSVPQIPSPDLSLFRSISWSTVWKTSLKSSIISYTLLLSSVAPHYIIIFALQCCFSILTFLHEDRKYSYKSCRQYGCAGDKQWLFFNKLKKIGLVKNKPEIVKHFLV